MISTSRVHSHVWASEQLNVQGERRSSSGFMGWQMHVALLLTCSQLRAAARAADSRRTHMGDSTATRLALACAKTAIKIQSMSGYRMSDGLMGRYCEPNRRLLHPSEWQAIRGYTALRLY